MNKKRYCRYAALHFILFTLFFCSDSSAIKTNGRITLGGVGVTERYSTDAFGSTKNDYLFVSSRFFYKVSEVGEDQWELVSDFREKYDRFGKLNKENLILEDQSDFQVRQLSARWLNPKGSYGAQFGRFQLPEAGAVFVDGAEFDYRWTPLWKTGLFGGYNPKSIENSYLQLETDAQEAGFFATYQSKRGGWDKNLFFSHGLVAQKYKAQEERSFFFHNLVYQWQEASRLISFLNYDFVPSSKIQTVNFIYQQKWTPLFSTELGYILIDVLEYRRKQGALEQLPASPYSEARVELLKNHFKSEVGLEVSSGQRQYDQLKRDEISLGYSHSDLILKNVDLRTKLGSRNNFTSKDTFVRVNLGYFTRKWEYSVDAQYEISANIDGTTTHPITVEASVMNALSKEIFLMGSVQRASDENVAILYSFFKIGYRFGNQEIPPIRDGSSPRGSL
ncbi:MAG TPA: hypothetical protein PLJ21_01525 [Pseudobdellovibrionaceae bacterium]|nr:hypothetical protein [Pseudobdellovibrionaceae bacterium]